MSSIRLINDLPYANYNGRILHLDLAIPAGPKKPLPVIVYVRGGGWQATEKKGLTIGSTIAADGFAVATIEYRSSTEVIAPGNVHDCKAAVRWVRANAATYGFDPARIGATGGSAGGHLVALLGMTNGIKELEGHGGNPTVSSDVQAVCDFCGPTDLTSIAQPEYRKDFQVLYDVTAQYLGGSVEDRRDLALLVSPLHYAKKASVPMLIVHGEADDVVAVKESILLHEALKKSGSDVALRVLPGVGHGWDWQLTRDDVIGFFRRTLSVS